MGSILSNLLGGGGAGEVESKDIIYFHDSEKWKNHLEDSRKTDKLMVVYFTATWCGPCRFMNPALKDLAERNTDIEFIKIDVDELKDVAGEYGIDAMPTFVFIKSGKVLDRVVGAKKNELEKMIEKCKN